MHRPGTDVWYAQWYVDGKAVRKSTGTRVKEEALTKLRKFMADSESGKPVVDGKLRYAVLRTALIDNYVTKGNKKPAPTRRWNRSYCRAATVGQSLRLQRHG